MRRILAGALVGIRAFDIFAAHGSLAVEGGDGGLGFLALIVGHGQSQVSLVVLESAVPPAQIQLGAKFGFHRLAVPEDRVFVVLLLDFEGVAAALLEIVEGDVGGGLGEGLPFQ